MRHSYHGHLEPLYKILKQRNLSAAHRRIENLLKMEINADRASRIHLNFDISALMQFAAKINEPDVILEIKSFTHDVILENRQDPLTPEKYAEQLKRKKDDNKMDDAFVINMLVTDMEFKEYLYTYGIARYCRGNLSSLSYSGTSWDDIFIYDAIFTLKSILFIHDDWTIGEQNLRFLCTRLRDYKVVGYVYPVKHPHSPTPWLRKFITDISKQKSGVESLHEIALRNIREALQIMGLPDSYRDRTLSCAKMIKAMADFTMSSYSGSGSHIVNFEKFKSWFDRMIHNTCSEKELEVVKNIREGLYGQNDDFMEIKTTSIPRSQAVQFLFTMAYMNYFREYNRTHDVYITTQERSDSGFINDVFATEETLRLARIFSGLEPHSQPAKYHVTFEQEEYKLTVLSLRLKQSVPSSGEWDAMCRQKSMKGAKSSMMHKLISLEKEVSFLLQELELHGRKLKDIDSHFGVDSADRQAFKSDSYINLFAILKTISIAVESLVASAGGTKLNLSNFEKLAAMNAIEMRRVQRNVFQIPNAEQLIGERMQRYQSKLELFEIKD